MIQESKAFAHRRPCGAELAEFPRRSPASPDPPTSMSPGDQVEWTNASFVLETRGGGEIVHLFGDHAAIFNTEIARRHPDLNPYVSKRIDELRLVRQALAS